eukprot:Lithocolla_globosa_v1_NODE_3738_length_1594_cov_115.705653.p1 type:complete len:140 gc:universal NODE_3738_length_1594_cov_115.705653:569-150(-)
MTSRRCVFLFAQALNSLGAEMLLFPTTNMVHRFFRLFGVVPYRLHDKRNNGKSTMVAVFGSCLANDVAGLPQGFPRDRNVRVILLDQDKEVFEVLIPSPSPSSQGTLFHFFDDQIKIKGNVAQVKKEKLTTFPFDKNKI